MNLLMGNNQDSKPLVTIGIPTYNRADTYLKGALEAAVSQTYPNIEILISDNASTDNTEELVSSFKDARIRYIRQSKNIGALNNANFCIKQAKGDYFLLLHDDDLIDSDFMETCMRAVNYNTDTGVILTGTRVIDEKGAVKFETTNNVSGLSITDFFLTWFNNRLPLYLCSTLYNTGRLQEIGGFVSKKNLYNDNAALFQLAARYGRKDIQDVKASFRMHSSNSGLAASINDWCEDSLYLLDIMCSLSGSKKELIRKKGMVYFCNVNYGYIRDREIQSLFRRIHDYWLVYRKFEYCCSPVHVMLAGNIIYEHTYRILSFIKRKIKEIL